MELHLTDRLADLAGTSVDIAVRMTAAPAPGLVARKLTTVRYIACASPDYLQRHAAPDHPDDLVRHNCLFYAGDIVQNPWEFAGPDGRKVVHVSGSLRVNSVEILRNAAVNGLGIVMIAHYLVCDELACGELVELLVDHPLAERAIYLVTLPDRLLAAKTRAFIDFLWQRDTN
jgi:DNA-binding transcriptional LysR family regulator